MSAYEYSEASERQADEWDAEFRATRNREAGIFTSSVYNSLKYVGSVKVSTSIFPLTHYGEDAMYEVKA